MRSAAPLAALLLLVACTKGDPTPGSGATASVAADLPPPPPAPIVVPTEGPKNVVHIAAGSKEHTTLVAALQAADYVDSLTNPGPFTVFAPTNAAFDKLPKGTVESLLTPPKRGDLKNILQYHVAVSIYQAKDLKDGQTLGMANGGKVTFHLRDGKVMVNDAAIVASIPASNGIVHVVDGVLLPQQ